MRAHFLCFHMAAFNSNKRQEYNQAERHVAPQHGDRIVTIDYMTSLYPT